MRNMTLGWRLGASFGVLILLIGVVGGIAIYRINLTAASASNVSTKRGPEVQVSNMVKAVAWETRFNIHGYSLSGNAENLRTGRRMLATLKDHLKTARELADRFPDLDALKKGEMEASDKTAAYEALVDKIEFEYKNGVVQDVALEDSSTRFMETVQALRLSEQKRMIEELDEWEGQPHGTEPNAKAPPSTEEKPHAKVDLAALKERLMKLGMIDDMVDAYHTIRIHDFKAAHDDDIDARSGVLKEFVTLGKIISSLTPLVHRQENIKQLDRIQQSAEDYKVAMEKDLKCQFAIREHTKDLFSTGQAVTTTVAKVADGGIKVIARDASVVSLDLDLTRTIVEIGLLLAVIAGVLIAWLCTRAITLPIREGVNALAATASQISTTISQLASNASETAAAVAETTTTVDEVRQTAQVAADKAKSVADSAHGSVLAAEIGRKATEQTVQGFNLIRSQMSSIGESITRLNMH
ncbi:MAG: hypothetical protein WCS43_19480, partial [Verrucomicrobiota bacterium]